MTQSNSLLPGTVAVLLACGFSALSQDSASLDRYLSEHFPATKFEKGKLVKPGAVLTVQRDGIGSLAPHGGVAMGRSGVPDLAFPNSFKSGVIHHDGKSVFLASSGSIRDLSVGERVYVMKIDVKDANIVFNVQTCGKCDPNFPDPEHLPARANVNFQFSKQYLSSATPAQVEEVIANVFKPEQPGSNTSYNAPPSAQPPAQSSAPPPSQPPSQPNAPMAPIAPPPPPDSPAPPPAPQATAEIKIGQTTDQIIAALGQPLQIFNLGPKVVYKYKSLKVTFVNGKVSDVE
jgi:hypothetical protein